MMNLKKAAVLPAMAVLAMAGLVGSLVSASAQSAYTDGSTAQRRAPAVRHRAGERPLTVRRRYEGPLPVATLPPPSYNPYLGPGAIVTAPVGAASTLVGLPFRVLGGIFPSNGSPLMLIGAPIQFAGRLAQVPFQVVEAPFGGPGPFSGPEPLAGPFAY